MEQKYSELKTRLRDMTDINSAASVLHWDQATYLPEMAADQRGRQISILSKMAHDILTAQRTGQLIQELHGWAHDLPDTDSRKTFVFEAKRILDLEIQVPSQLRSEMTEHFSKIYTAWAQAKPKNDFEAIRPLLQKSVEYSRRFSECFSGFDHPMDALIQYSDRGVTVASARKIFSDLRSNLVPIVKKVTAAKQIDSRFLEGDFPETEQLDFCKVVAECLGYDFSRGRMDLSPHPFMTRLSGNDIRITTRARRDDLTDCLFSVIHEVGHALYELGIHKDFDDNILGGGVSSGVHESQSRLWENCVGRSEPFWKHFYPILQNKFPHFKSTGLATFIRGINKVEPGLIRVDADELTYNLHVMIRFDLECQMLEGTLKVKDLPEAWNARYQSDLGVKAPNYATGCMQDVHWFGGQVGGAFQGYTIGNILSAQFFHAAKRDLPHLEEEFASGKFASLRNWLNKNLHQYGSCYAPDELIVKATGEPMNAKYYVDYLSSKYFKLYGIAN